MNNLLMIAVGGALGAVSRYGVGNIVNSFLQQKYPLNHFPFATLAVNFFGSFFIGILYVLIVEQAAIHQDWRNVLMVGVLGSFTTFSTFSLETVNLLENGHIATALGYMISSLLCCIVGVWIAMTVTRLL
ncbi:MAG: CrcB protein [Paraglaciecola psychrophila]|jgi:CrcB protein